MVQKKKASKPKTPTSNGANGHSSIPSKANGTLNGGKSKKNGKGPTIATVDATPLETEKEMATVVNAKALPPPKPLSRTVLILRTLLLDTPLALLFCLFLSLVILQYVGENYLSAQLKLMRWADSSEEVGFDRQEAEATYYNRVCSVKDVTTTNVDDLVMGPNVTAQESMEHILEHGVSIYPDVVSGPTADKLRDFILERNKKEQGLYYVIQNKNRYSFGIGVNQHPLVSQALKEITNHPTLVPALEKICGRNPAVIEFTAITAEYGAEEQWWHQDTLPSGSSFKHARSFIPSYSLFIPLQDTSASMGATEMCPGSHVCDGTDAMCKQLGFKVSGAQDKWPRSYGALMNQHTHHRGTAHTLEGGPARVLFILTFAPRPQTGPNELETKLISTGGSYSIDWRNWGHTVDDFRNAPTAMAEPYKTLRALGVYKPSKADWGWDWITLASMRIANSEASYSEDDLTSFIENGGFRYLPKFLQSENDLDGWEVYMKETVQMCKKFAGQVNLAVIGAYLVLAALASLVIWMRGASTRQKNVLWGCIKRLIVTHGCLVILALAVVHHVNNSPWAKKVHSGKLYRPVDTPIDAEVGGTTLPNTRDVLVDTKYNSKALASYNHIIDLAHPGNKDFYAMVRKNSVGYPGLPVPVKVDLLNSMFEWVGQSGGRFLTSNNSASWSKVPQGQATYIIHTEIMKENSPVLREVLAEVAYLLSETKFGILRRAALHRQHIPAMLSDLHYKLLDPPVMPRKITPNQLQVLNRLHYVVGKSPSYVLVPFPREMTRAPRMLSVRSFVPALTTRKGHQATRSFFAPAVPVKEPFQSAWLEEGDVVEGKYNCKHNEWYRGTVYSVSTDNANYDVEYDDGDSDVGLSRSCVRPFVPYALGEAIAVQADDGSYMGGRVTKVHSQTSYDVETKIGKTVTMHNVTTSQTRRVDGSFKRGARIEALFQGEGESWYAGVIQKVNKDGSFNVKYDDGDIEYEVEPQHIRLSL